MGSFKLRKNRQGAFWTERCALLKHLGGTLYLQELRCAAQTGRQAECMNTLQLWWKVSFLFFFFFFFVHKTLNNNKKKILKLKLSQLLQDKNPFKIKIKKIFVLYDVAIFFFFFQFLPYISANRFFNSITKSQSTLLILIIGLDI